MFSRGTISRGAALALVAACFPLAQLSLAVPPAAAATRGFAFRGEAYGSSARLGAGGVTAGSGRSALVVIGCTMQSQKSVNSAVSVSIPALKSSLEVITNQVSSASGARTGTWSVSAQSVVSHVSLLHGLVKAKAVTVHARASESSGGGRASGRTDIVALTVAGKSVTVGADANKQINLAGVGTLTLNQQARSVTGGSAFMLVNGIVINITVPGNPLGLPVGTLIVVAHARVRVAGPVSGLLGGLSYGTALTSNLVNSGESFPEPMGCTGTGGVTITNTGLGFTAGPLTAGTIKDTANGTDQPSRLSARTGSAIETVRIAGVLTAQLVTSTASAKVINRQTQVSGNASFISLSGIGGLHLPAHPPANTTVPLATGTLILNRQVVFPHRILVQAVYLQDSVLGTIIIASASASAR